MSLRHERDNALRVLNALMGYFRSGNNVPVTHATLRAASTEVQDALKVLKNPRVRLMQRRGWRPRRYR